MSELNKRPQGSSCPTDVRASFRKQGGHPPAPPQRLCSTSLGLGLWLEAGGGGSYPWPSLHPSHFLGYRVDARGERAKGTGRCDLPSLREVGLGLNATGRPQGQGVVGEKKPSL